MKRAKNRLSIFLTLRRGVSLKCIFRKLIDSSRAEVTEPKFVLKHIKDFTQIYIKDEHLKLKKNVLNI